MSKSRTKNVSKNAAVGTVCQVTNLLLQFATRTFFIKILGAEYLGVNGLFTNILTILSFAELGIGNAIVFSLYKPLAVNDTEKIKSLMALYRRAYLVIGIVVGVLGLCLSPFLNVIIKNKPNIPEKITVLYVLFLANSVISYFFAYKKSIIIADQRNYIVIAVSQLVYLLKTAVQIAFLYLTHKYISFLVIQVVFTFIENGVCSVIANRLYTFLREPATMLGADERKHIFDNVKALVLYKFGSVILNGTDNILISSLVGIKDVGLASNYFLIANACNAILGRITEAFTSSVGNLNAIEKPDKQYDVFKKILFLTSILYGYAYTGLMVVGQSFIQTWIGEDYLLSNMVLFAIAIEFYVKGIHSVCYTYRTTLGLFMEGRWSAVAAALTNLFFSIFLYHYFGLAGILIATPIARIVTLGVVDPILIFKKSFRKNVLKYYSACLMYFGFFSGISILASQIVCYMHISGWSGVIIQIIIVTIIFGTITFISFFRSKMFQEIICMANRELAGKVRNLFHK